MTLPALSLPIRYSKHPFGALFALLLIPFAMLIDLFVGSCACILFFLTRKTALKQLAWNCLICGSIGALITSAQILRGITKF